MGDRTTGDLQAELMAAPDLDRFLRNNNEVFVQNSFADLLWSLFSNRDISKAELAKRSAMSEVYLHQLFAGERHPSRNRILCLCFGLSATLEDTQELLRGSGSAQLYARNRRDAIILYGLSHGLSLCETNDYLYRESEPTLF